MTVRELADRQLSAEAPITAAALRRQAKRRQRRRLVPVVRLAILTVVIGFWEIGSRLGVIETFHWSQPSSITSRIWLWSIDGTFATNLFITLYEALLGFVIGMAAGVTVGFLLGTSDFWARVFNPIIQVLNAVPRLMFAPLLFIIFGLGVTSKIALVAIVVFYLCFWNAFHGVRDVDRNVYNNALMLGAKGTQISRHVLLPSAMTWILSSLHIAIGHSVTASVVGEYFGSIQGLGNVVARSAALFDQTGVIAGLIVLSGFVVLVEAFVTVAERRLWKWKPLPAGDLDAIT